MKINDAIFGALLVVIGIAVLIHVQSFPRIPGQNVGPALFPGLVAAGLCICGVALIVLGIRSHATQPWVETGAWMQSPRHVIAFVATIVVVAAYIAFAERVGFLIIAPLLLFGLFLAYGVRAGTAATAAIVVTLVIHYAFYKLLRVPLPWGWLTPYAW